MEIVEEEIVHQIKCWIEQDHVFVEMDLKGLMEFVFHNVNKDFKE